MTQRGIAFIEKDVEANEAIAREAIALSGQHGTPIITVGDQVIVGFQRRALDQALGLGAADARIEASLPPAQDTVRDLIAARRVTLTADQEALAARFRELVDTAALCGYVGEKLDYFPLNCDDTFRHVSAFLTAHPVEGTDSESLLGMLRTLNLNCDCAYAINLCR
jgi:hypothetical protein